MSGDKQGQLAFSIMGEDPDGGPEPDAAPDIPVDDLDNSSGTPDVTTVVEYQVGDYVRLDDGDIGLVQMFEAGKIWVATEYGIGRILPMDNSRITGLADN